MNIILKPEFKKLLIKPANPDHICSLIPTARKVRYKEHLLLAIPHRTEEMRLLRNLGFEGPAPITQYYHWPCFYDHPLPHQIETAAFLTMNPRSYCLNGIGTMKTLSVLWAFDYLRREGLVKKMLVVCPMSTMELTWVDEIFRNFRDLTYAVVYGSKEKRKKMLAQDVDVYIINHDGIGTIIEEFGRKEKKNWIPARLDIDVIAIDEISQAARNANTDRWAHLRNLVSGRPIVWGLTGTPIPNEPSDAWAQCRLVRPETVPLFFGAFRDMVMRQVSQFTWISRENAVDTVAKVMQPSIRFKRDDVIKDLPPVTYETKSVEMSKEQKAMDTPMVNQLMAEYAGEEILAVHEGVKAMKLVQIATGVVYGNTGEDVIIPAQARLDMLKELVDAATGKAIVFVPFKGAIRHVAEFLSTWYDVHIINSDVPKHERDATFRSFQNGEKPDVIVAQAGCMSHGLNLTAANTIIWFAPIYSNDIYEQANGRITRPGQKLPQLIVHIEGSSIERRIYTRLEKKGKMQGLLLSLLEESQN